MVIGRYPFGCYMFVMIYMYVGVLLLIRLDTLNEFDCYSNYLTQVKLHVYAINK